MTDTPAQAMLALRHNDDQLRVCLGGDWLVNNATDRPGIGEVELALQARPVSRLTVEDEGIGRWDSTLLLFLYQLRHLCTRHEVELDCSTLPEGVRRLLKLPPRSPLLSVNILRKIPAYWNESALPPWISSTKPISSSASSARPPWQQCDSSRERPATRNASYGS